MVGAIAITGVLGWGMYLVLQGIIYVLTPMFVAINVSLAFCMGTDLEGIVGGPSGQPMAQIFFNSFGQKGTLAVWVSIFVLNFCVACH